MPGPGHLIGRQLARASPQVDPRDELARQRARVSELKANEPRLATEREILRAAPKYFTGETTW